MREVLTDILAEVGTAIRQIRTSEVLKLISDVIRFTLTLAVHDQLREYRLIYYILDSSSQIFTVNSKKRKQFLYNLLQDHGIWSDMSNWAHLIRFSLLMKIGEAKERQRIREDS